MPSRLRPGFWNTPLSLLFCAPSNFSPLGSQRGCRRQAWHTAGWVGVGSQLGPESRDWAQRAIGIKGIPRNFPKLLVAPSTEPLVPRRCPQHLPSSLSLYIARTRSLKGQSPHPFSSPWSLVSSYRHLHVATLLPWVKSHKWE